MKSALFIAGPTASGKSALAVAIAKAYDGVVINADSMQVYRDLRILSARPGASEEEVVPHRLFGVLDGAELCSAAKWHDMATAEIETAWAKAKLPILVGGTGLYFRTILEGLAPVPDIPNKIRNSVRSQMAAKGPVAMHDMLKDEDPVMAGKLKPADSQRIARALEVVRATGVSLATYQEQKKPGGLAAANKRGLVLKTVLDMPRAELYARCDRRFDQMMEAGALDEVQALAARNLDPDLPIMKALGVPALIQYLSGSQDKDQALEEAKRQTRRYAKRQSTWMRTQFPDWVRLDAAVPQRCKAYMAGWIEEKGQALWQ